MVHDPLKTTLITMIAAALALGILTLLVVFYPTGTYRAGLAQNQTANRNATSTASSTNAFSSSTATSTATGSSTANQFSSEYSYPYPVTWSEGDENFSVTGASFQNNQLTLTLAIQMGSVSECVPLNVRLVADEAGTLKAPDAPGGGSFSFPDTQSCDGTPGATYSQSVTFGLEPSIASPFLLTSGGNENVYFTVATSTSGGVDVALPGNAG